MKTRRHFQSRIRLLGIAAAILGLATLMSVSAVTLKYEDLVDRVRGRGLSELQRQQNIQREVAGIHLGVIRLLADESRARDEQRIYAESKKIADALDQLLEQHFDALISADKPATPVEKNLREAIVRYRADVLLSLEMMTVNPRLSERYLLRSAITLSEFNIAVAHDFDRRRSAIEEDIASTRDRTSREIIILIVVMMLIMVAVMFAIFRLTRRLAANFRVIEGALAGIQSGSPHTAVSADHVEGEFKAVAESLGRFNTVLAERDFSRSQMLAIFESILEAVVVIDHRGCIIQTNPMVTKLFGYPQQELIGKNIKILTPPEIERHHDQYLERYAANGVAGNVVGKIRTTEGRHRNGQLFPIQLAVSEVAVGPVKYFVGVIADITERVNSERVLQEARDAALSSSRLKADFLATMSHEIRTPMNGILGMAQLLVDDGISVEERRNCARVLLGSSETLITLLNDILDLSKVEAGKLTFNVERTSPALLTRQAAALFIEAANAKGVQLSVSSTVAEASRYMLDPIRVRQMLSNLIGNAVKFTEAGGIHVESDIERKEDGRDMLVFRVRDSGPGIAAGDLPTLFAKYSQVDKSSTRNHGGSGLGLSIVRQFAQALDGDVGVESKPGEGSTFWFSLPAIVPADTRPRDVDGARASAPQISPQRFPSFDGRVLIAEDTPANQIVLKLLLGRLGIESTMVSNGREAIDAVSQNEPFDCILMDMRMPVMDGEEATRLIRQWEATNGRARCPIIAVTANAYEDDRQRCRAAGMDDFIAKPVKMSELRRILERWMARGHADRVEGQP